MGRERKKRADRDAKSRARQEAQKRVDGRDRQINQKLPNEENAVKSRELASHLSDDAARAVGEYHYKNSSLPGRAVKPEILDLTHIHPNVKDPVRGDRGLRKCSGTGSAVTASSSDHVHSIDFKNLPEEARNFLLASRQAVREDVEESTDSRYLRLAGLVLGLAHMKLDDPDMSGDEWQVRMKNDPEFRAEYEEKHAHDYGNGPEPKRLGKHEKSAAPDVSRNSEGGS